MKNDNDTLQIAIIGICPHVAALKKSAGPDAVPKRGPLTDL